ncbi:MAG: hypothetical protein WKF35_09060 [Ferruginibacter sp.]
MIYHNKTFRPATASVKGDVNNETVFIYRQDGNIITASYAGGKVVSGHLIAIMDEDGKLDMRYHHINDNNKLMTGTCCSTPEVLANGKMILHEKWQWTSGDMSKGESVIEEI